MTVTYLLSGSEHAVEVEDTDDLRTLIAEVEDSILSEHENLRSAELRVLLTERLLEALAGSTEANLGELSAGSLKD